MGSECGPSNKKNNKKKTEWPHTQAPPLQKSGERFCRGGACSWVQGKKKKKKEYICMCDKVLQLSFTDCMHLTDNPLHFKKGLGNVQKWRTAAGYGAKKREYICMCDKVLQKYTYNLCKRTFILLTLFVSFT